MHTTASSFYIVLPSNTIEPPWEAAKRPIAQIDLGVPIDQLHGIAAAAEKDAYEEIVGNQQSNFRVQLPYMIALDGDYDVGLCEIIYTHSWHNVGRDVESSQITLVMRTQAEFRYLESKDIANEKNRKIAEENKLIAEQNKTIPNEKDKLPLKPRFPNPGIPAVMLAEHSV